MKREIKKILLFLLTTILVGNLYAKSQIKIKCDRDGEDIYFNGKFKTECDKNELVTISITPGKYNIEVKKKNKDETFYYFKKTFRIGDGIQKSINVKSKLIYPEKYYYKKAVKSKKYQDYLQYIKKYPKGRYAKKVRNILKGSWIKTFGGKKDDEVRSVIPTKDGGFIVAGDTNSFGAEKSDIWIVKLDKKGNKIWEKIFGAEDEDHAYSIIQTKDGGYAVAGSTKSFGNGGFDFWILKLDKDGNRIWDGTYGDIYWEEAYSIIETKNGGFIVSGYTLSSIRGSFDLWIVKLNKEGDIIWDKSYGGKEWDEARSMIQTKEEEIILAGFTKSLGAGERDIWILKLNKDGTKVWEKTFGRKDWDEAHSIIQTKDGGFVIAGKTSSSSNGSFDFWILKLDKNGNKVWDKTFGAKEWDEAISILQTKDDGYIIAGNTKSFGAGMFDIWIIKLNKNGKKVWEKTFGGSDWEYAKSIIQTKDKGIIIIGDTKSFGAGRYDWWIIKAGKNFIREWKKR